MKPKPTTEVKYIKNMNTRDITSMSSSSSSPPGVVIDKQTTLRLTSTKTYIEEDVNSLLSSDNTKRPSSGLMKRLQWRSGGNSNNSNNANDGNGTSASTLLLPPSTSPLSRKIGLPTPGINKIRGVEGRRGDVVDDTTIASGRTWRSGVSTRTLKWSNRRGRK